METFASWFGIAIGVFALWALARHDWLRLTRKSQTVTAEIVDHHETRDEGRPMFAPIYRFLENGRSYDVVDAVLKNRRTPPIGTKRILVFPQGHPELARPPRWLMWIAVYLFLAIAIGMLAAHLLGWPK
jgi:uncharacterized membrane protein YccC